MPKRITNAVTVAVMSLLFVGVCSFSPPAAEGHSWYDLHCCKGYDCAPIREMQRMPDGSLVVTNENGDTAVFPPGFPIQEPQDGKRHACISPYSKKPICLYLPAEI